MVTYVHSLIAVVSWLTIVFRGYQPAGIHNALTFTNGYIARAEGYLGLLTDTYPPVGARGPPGRRRAPGRHPSVTGGPGGPRPEQQAPPPPPPAPEPPAS